MVGGDVFHKVAPSTVVELQSSPLRLHTSTLIGGSLHFVAQGMFRLPRLGKL